MENKVNVEQCAPCVAKISDLVRVEIQGKYNTEHGWFRIAIINNDNTFCGMAEKIDRHNDKYIIGNQYLLDYYPDMIIYTDQQLCYSDNVSICTCPGLCREK